MTNKGDEDQEQGLIIDQELLKKFEELGVKIGRKEKVGTTSVIILPKPRNNPSQETNSKFNNLSKGEKQKVLNAINKVRSVYNQVIAGKKADEIE